MPRQVRSSGNFTSLYLIFLVIRYIGYCRNLRVLSYFIPDDPCAKQLFLVLKYELLSAGVIIIE